MLFWFVFVFIYSKDYENVRMCEILYVLYFAHFERFHWLIRVQILHSHLVQFQHNQSISKRWYHNVHIILTYFLFCEHNTKFLSKIIHYSILKHLLQLVLIFVLELVEFLLLLKLLWVYLLNDTIVLFKVDVKLGWGWTLIV